MQLLTCGISFRHLFVFHLQVLSHPLIHIMEYGPVCDLSNGAFHSRLKTHLFFKSFPSGHILTVQSNQFCAVQKAKCAVQVAELCSPKYVLWTFTQINYKSYLLICCICRGGRRVLATCLFYKWKGCTVSANSVAGLQRLTVLRIMPYSDKTSASKVDKLIRKFWLKNFF